MADGYGLAPLMRILSGNFQLMAYGRDFLNIIKERYIAKGTGHAGVLRRIISDRSRGGAAVNKEELVIAEDGHEFGHQLRIGGCEGALMVVHACRKGNGV